MTIETKFNIGDIVVAVPPRRKKEASCEVLGVSASSHRRWFANENRIETIIRYTLKYKSGISEWEIFRIMENKVRRADDGVL